MLFFLHFSETKDLFCVWCEELSPTLWSLLLPAATACPQMAGMNMLCSDKTGTLTKNILTVEEPYCLPGVSAQDMYLAAVLASKREHADAIDTAMCKTVS